MEFHRRKGTTPNCSECNYPEVRVGNKQVIDLAKKYGSMLIDSTEFGGNISSAGIKLALELENIEYPRIATRKLIIYLSEILKAQQEKK